MKAWRKQVATLAAAISLATLPLSASADSEKSVNVNANIISGTPSYFGLNFDSVTFTGDLGTTQRGTVTSNGEEVNPASYTVNSRVNFDVYVSSTNLTSPDGKELLARRLTATQYQAYGELYSSETPDYYNYEGSTQLSKGLMKLYSGTEQQDVKHYLTFDLDLSYTGNSLPDNHVLLGLEENTPFTSQITFTFSGL